MSAYSDRVIADGCSYYWRLGDLSGTTAVATVGGANGTISGGVTLAQPGALADGDKAMTFNGTTGQIVTAATITLPLTVTVEAWINTPAMGALVQFPAFSITQGGVEFVYCGLVNNFLFVSSYTGGGSVRGVIATSPLMWHHAVYVLSASTVTLYTDGVLDSTLSLAHLATTGVAMLGWNSDTGNFFTGSLDEIALYPRALTAPEVAAHYALRTAGGSSSRPDVPFWSWLAGGRPMEQFNVWRSITPSDTVDLPGGTSEGIWVGGAGDVAAVMANNVMPVVLAAVPAGAWLPIAAKRINATGTTATGLVALYEN